MTVATYQAASGAGAEAMRELAQQVRIWGPACKHAVLKTGCFSHDS